MSTDDVTETDEDRRTGSRGLFCIYSSGSIVYSVATQSIIKPTTTCPRFVQFDEICFRAEFRKQEQSAPWSWRIRSVSVCLLAAGKPAPTGRPGHSHYSNEAESDLSAFYTDKLPNILQGYRCVITIAIIPNLTVVTFQETIASWKLQTRWVRGWFGPSV